MASGRLIWPLAEPVLDANGDVVSGALLYVYQNNTTTPADIFADVELATPILNPQTSNSAGRFFQQSKVIWADTSVRYTLRLERPDGTFDVLDDVEAATGPLGAGDVTLDLLDADAKPGNRGHIAGLTLSTAGSSTTFSVAAGEAAAATTPYRVMKLAASINKTTSAWAVGSGNGGLLSGTIANNTLYRVWEIERPDTGVVDVGVEVGTNATPTLPANYTLYRQIGWLRTNGSAQWVKFYQSGDEFLWDVPVGDVNAVAIGTAGSNITLTAPPNTEAILNVTMNSDTATVGLLIHSKRQANQATNTVAGNTQLIVQANNQSVSAQVRVRLDGSSQARAVSNATSQSCSLYVATQGYVDRRGRDD